MRRGSTGVYDETGSVGWPRANGIRWPSHRQNRAHPAHPEESVGRYDAVLPRRWSPDSRPSRADPAPGIARPDADATPPKSRTGRIPRPVDGGSGRERPASSPPNSPTAPDPRGRSGVDASPIASTPPVPDRRSRGSTASSAIRSGLCPTRPWEGDPTAVDAHARRRRCRRAFAGGRLRRPAWKRSRPAPSVDRSATAGKRPRVALTRRPAAARPTSAVPVRGGPADRPG